MNHNNYLLDNSNSLVANTCSVSGRMNDISGFLCPNGRLSNFVISGGAAEERYDSLSGLLSYAMGQLPVIVLHSESPQLENILCGLWTDKGCSASPLWVSNKSYTYFEPLYGMTEWQTTRVLQKLAAKLGFTTAPRFDRVVRAHLSILRELDIPVSLTGLFYLCRHNDMGEFHDNVMALPCGHEAAGIIWSDLDVNDESKSGQFDLFRSVINRFAGEAEVSGWNPDNGVACYNFAQAIEQNAVFSLPVDDMHEGLMYTYLAEELKLCGRKPFLLLLDSVSISDLGIIKYLCSQSTGCRMGIVSDNAMELLGGENGLSAQLAERIGCFVLFKHGTAKTALSLSEVIGKYDYTKAECSRGTTRGLLSILPNGMHEEERYTVENRFRVMPEEILALRKGQAIIFDTAEDVVFRYN